MQANEGIQRRLCPAGTWRLYNVGSTSMQRHDVASTLRRRCINVLCLLGEQRPMAFAVCFLVFAYLSTNQFLVLSHNGGCASDWWSGGRELDPCQVRQHYFVEIKLFLAGLGGSVGCAVRLETRRSRVQPPPRSATFFRGDWSWNIFYGHSLPSADSRRAVVSFWRKNVHNTG